MPRNSKPAKITRQKINPSDLHDGLAYERVTPKSNDGIRRLPGGSWFGMLMFVCTFLSLVSDIAVSGLVKTVTVPSRCLFGTGLVVPDSNSSISSVPPDNGATYSVAAQAQLTSAANGGLVGIYWKANRDLTFRADELDLAGQWNCIDINDEIEYAAGTSIIAIGEDLIQRGYLYGPGNQSSAVRTTYENGTFSHLIWWDSSAPLSHGGMSFDIRASIDLTPNAPDPKIMKSFQCTMNGTSVEWVLENLNSSATLLLWSLPLQGNIYNGQGSAASNDSRLILERFLNTLVMVAGGNNYLINTPPGTGDDAGNTQGCLVSRTSVPWEIIFLFAIVSVVALVIIVDFIFGKIGRSLHRADRDYLSRIKHETPNSLFDWMAQSVRERIFQEDVESTFKEGDLRRWGFSPRDNDIGLGVQRLEQP